MTSYIQLIEKEAGRFYPDKLEDKKILRRIIPSLFDNKSYILYSEYDFVLECVSKHGLELRTQPLLMEA